MSDHERNERAEFIKHRLKTWPEPFEQVWRDEKTFEFRKDDRGYKRGDSVVLVEYDPEAQEETGREIAASIGYVLRGGAFGVPREYVVFSLLDPTCVRHVVGNVWDHRDDDEDCTCADCWDGPIDEYQESDAWT